MDCQEELRLTRQALEASLQTISALQRIFTAQQKVISERLSIVAPAFINELNAELDAGLKEIDQAAAKSAPYFEQIGMGRLNKIIPGSTTKQ
jgi:hypothetical protein